MRRTTGLRALLLALATATATLFAGCGTTGGLRYAKDVENLQENIRLTFRPDSSGFNRNGDPVRGHGSGVVTAPGSPSRT